MALDSYRLAPGVRMTGDRNTDLSALYSLPAGSIGAAVDQIAGTVNGDVMNAAVSLERMMASAVDNHRRGIGKAAENEESAWSTGLGQWTATGSDANAPGYRVSAGGIIGGMDALRTADSKVGVTGAFAQGNVKTDNAAVATIQSERVGVYGGLLDGDWRFDSELALGADQYKTRRTVALGSLVRSATGKSSGYGLSADGAVHYDGWSYVSPFAEMRDDLEHRASFTEQGVGGLSLAVADETLNTPRSLLGVELHDEGGIVKTSLKLAWAHDFGQIAGQPIEALTGSPLVAFTARSSQLGADAGVAHLAVSSEIASDLNAFIEYDGEMRTHSTSQSVFAGLHFNW